MKPRQKLFETAPTAARDLRKKAQQSLRAKSRREWKAKAQANGPASSQ